VVDNNRPGEAEAVLRSQVNANNARPAAQQVPNVTAENGNLSSWAKELQEKGALGKSAQKVLKYDNYQDRANVSRVPVPAR
jgi:hypothetical protein